MFPVLWGLWISESTHEGSATHALAVELTSVAESLGDSTSRLEAHHAMWQTLMMRGEPRAALLHAERGITLYNPQEHSSVASLYGGHGPGVCARNHAAQVLWLLGRPEQAGKSSREAIALAQELAVPHNIAQALAMGAMVSQFRQDRVSTAERAEATIALSAEHGFAQWVTMGTILRGWAASDPSTRERDRATLREAIAAWGRRFYLPYFLALTAEVCCELKSVDEASELVAQALESVHRSGQSWYEAELQRLVGEISLLHDCSLVSEAERSFRTAIEIARKQEAKSLELRAVTSLARLRRDTNRRDEARNMLTEIYNSFTEGFDTADLKDAKALIDELSE